MGKVLTSGGGGGVTSADVTGTKAMCLAGFTFVTSDSNDDAAEGTIVTKSDSGTTNLTANGASKTFAAGFYPNAHTVTAAISYADW